MSHANTRMGRPYTQTHSHTCSFSKMALSTSCMLSFTCKMASYSRCSREVLGKGGEGGGKENKQTNKQIKVSLPPSFLLLTQYCMWRLTFLTALWRVFPPVLLSLLSAVRLLSAPLAAWKEITIRLEVTQLDSVTVLWDHQEQLALTFPLSLHW